MKNALFILVDCYNVIIATISGSAGAEVDGLTTYEVSSLPFDFVTGKYIWNIETHMWLINPDYDFETATGKIYWMNVGWVDPDYISTNDNITNA